MGVVGGEPGGLAHGASTLGDVATGTRGAAAALGDAARACAAALDGPLAEELGRLAAATTSYAGDLATHVEAAGWLADHVGSDLARAGGVP